MSGQQQSLIGHEQVTERFKSLNDITLPVLFLGLSGVGKRTFALELASEVNSAMLRFLERPKVQDIRELQQWAVVKGFGGWKVLVLDLTSASIAAQNALLKLLEEPPVHLKIILYSSNEFVLATVKSRCVIVRFYPLSRQHLTLIYQRLGFDLQEAVRLAAFADGSVERGLQMKDLFQLQIEVDSLFDVAPAKAAKSILAMRDTRYIPLFLASATDRGLTLKHLILNARRAGVRGRLLLSTMLLKRSS